MPRVDLDGAKENIMTEVPIWRLSIKSLMPPSLALARRTIESTRPGTHQTAATHLYEQPYFGSTYRYAQFAHTVGQQKHYADLVRVLDLSYFGKEEETEVIPQAGWREWKYRVSILYHANGEKRTKPISAQPENTLTKKSHPPPHPYLDRWSLNRDIPVGGVCHVIAACQRLKKVNLSRLQLSEDFIVQHPEHPSTAWTGLMYASDVSRAWTWDDDQLVPIYPTEIIEHLQRLPLLETVCAKKSLWLTRVMATRLVHSCPKLEKLNLRGFGMNKDMRWAFKGTKDEVLLAIEDIEKGLSK